MPETYHFYKLFPPRTALFRPVSRSPSPSRLCAPSTQHDDDDDDGRSRFLRAGYLAIKLREPRTIARSRSIIAVQPHPHSIGSTSNGLSQCDRQRAIPQTTTVSSPSQFNPPKAGGSTREREAIPSPTLRWRPFTHAAPAAAPQSSLQRRPPRFRDYHLPFRAHEHE